MNGVLYNLSNGAILSSYSGPALPPKLEGKGFLETAARVDDRLWYVVDDALTERPILPIVVVNRIIAADGVAEARINAVPAGAHVTASGPAGIGSGTVNDGVLLFTADVPGAYVLQFVLFPFRTVEVLIDAN